MGFTYFENTAQLDDHLVSFDKAPQDADKDNVVKRITKKWDGVMSDLNGLAGIKLARPDFKAVADALIKSGTHAVIFDMVLTKSEFRLNVIVGKTTWMAGSVKVPTELEEYRNFLSLLNGWSNAAETSFRMRTSRSSTTATRRSPRSPRTKTSTRVAKKNKPDVEAFRAWAKGNGNGKKAFEAIDKTAKAKPTDPARVAAMKLINAALQDYYKTF